MNLPAAPQLDIQVMREDLSYFLNIPGVPGFNGCGSGHTIDEALQDLVADLRDYCAIWEEHLSEASNHAEAATVVHWVNQATDRDIKAWLINSPQPARRPKPVR